MEVLILADNQYKIKSYKIQRTYYKTSKYTLTLFIPPVEALEVQNGYNVNPNAILYLALPWNSETTHKRSIEIRVKNQRSILRKLSEALNWFDSIEDLKYVVSLNQCNKITANQAAGRSRALPDGSDSIYFMVTDNGFKYCKQKTKMVLGYLSEQKLKEPPFVYHM